MTSNQNMLRIFDGAVAIITGGASGIGRALVIVIPAWWKIMWWLNRLSPSLVLYLAQKNFEDMDKEFSQGSDKA